ncbi:MAG: DUF4198 domain-containing protein [Deltaproteobacteria bacterium]|nr:DUF4198 domain-containing protein [Deltaproteobacteria bacterium]
MRSRISTRHFPLITLVVLLWAVPSLAHDLWLSADNFHPRLGQNVAVEVVFGHNFPYYDILITKDALTEFTCIRPDGARVDVQDVREEHKGGRKGFLTGKVRTPAPGTYVVTASRVRKGDKEHVPSEKFGKTILEVGGGSPKAPGPVGHRIEIVPLANPSGVKPGGALPVRILFEGKPLSTYVYATYAGYSSEDEPFPVIARTDETGVASIPISRPGVWLVVANHKVNFSASLTFEIR